MFKGIAFMALFLVGGTFVAMLLWNQVVVPAFGAPILNFWQILGLMVLGRLLTGGFGRRPGGWGGHRHSMHRRWHAMSEEERAAFKARWQRKKEGE